MKHDVLIEAAAPAYKVVTVEANDEETARVVAVKECENMDSSEFSLECPIPGYQTTYVWEAFAILVLSEEEMAEAASEESLACLFQTVGAGGVQ